MKIIINGINYDIINDINALIANYDNIMNYNIAFNDGTYVLPVKTDPNIKRSPYYFLHPLFGLLITNPEFITEEYSVNNIIDFNDVNNIKDYINKVDIIKNINNDFIAKCNNEVVEFPINEDDEPELKLLKEAINIKGIDIHSYKHRFGNTFSNVLRELKTSNKISINRLKDVAEALDLKITMSIEDTSASINPMNSNINKIITNERSDL